VNVLHELRHRAGPPPVLLHSTEVPADTWAGLLADGCYRRLTDVCALRTDVVETADHRAQAIPGPLPVRSVIARRTAAWVHLGGDPPRRLDLLVPPGRRVDPAPDRRCSEAHLAAHDIQVIDGRAVTSPTRTLLDLVLDEPRTDQPGTDPLWPTLTALRDLGADPAAVLTRLSGRRGACRARKVLAVLGESPVRPG
jgi:hypothetical protein